MFNYTGDNEKVRKAVVLANDYELLNHVYGEILRAPQYDYSNAPNTYVAAKYFEFMRIVDINIKIYYPRWKWSKAMGYFSPADSRSININGYMLNIMTLEQIVSLFYHESAHSWDYTDSKYHVHHGDNSPAGKQNTMMYSINRYVYEFFNYEYKPKTFVPWYKKLYNQVKRFIYAKLSN
jgi:hypothetical protein